MLCLSVAFLSPYYLKAYNERTLAGPHDVEKYLVLEDLTPDLQPGVQGGGRSPDPGGREDSRRGHGPATAVAVAVPGISRLLI